MEEAKRLGATAKSLAWDLQRNHLTVGDSPLPIADGGHQADEQRPLADKPPADLQQQAVACRDAACQTAAESDSVDSTDVKEVLRANFFKLVVYEKLLEPEYLSYKILATALHFLSKMPSETAINIAKNLSSRAVTGAFLVLAVGLEAAGDEVAELEHRIRERCEIANKTADFAIAKAAIVESVGNFQGFADYMRC